MPDLKTQPNEKRCNRTTSTHILDLKPCCPISENPTLGSTAEINYEAGEYLLEVAALKAYVDDFVGGRGDVRSMEGMIQTIAQDCSDVLHCRVWVKANLLINPSQRMILECSAYPT